MKLTRRKKALGVILLLFLLLGGAFAFYQFSPQRRLTRHLVKAQITSNNGQFGAALVEYDKALAIDPSHEIALVERAHVRLKMEQYDRAADQFEHCIKLYPKNGRAWLGLIRARLGAKNIPAAETAVARLLEIKRDAAALLAAGDVQLAKDNYEAALSAYKQARAESPTEFEPVLRSVVLLRQLKRDHGARILLNEFANSASSKERDRALLLLADLTLQEERPQEALTMVNQAMEIKPSPELLLRRSEIYCTLNESAKARADVEQIFKDQPTPPPQAYIVRARCLFEHNETDAALRDALLAQRTFPNDPQIALLLARIHHRTKRDMQAEEEARRALVLSPDFFAAQDFLMSVLLERGNLDDAITLGRNLLKRPRRNENAVRMFLRACAGAGRPEEARKALEMQKTGSGGGLGMPMNTKSPINPEETAEQAVQKLSALPPEQLDTSSTQLLLGHSLLRVDRLPDAIRAFQRSAALDSSNLEARLALAGIYLALGNYDVGAQFLDDVVKAQPQAYKSLAWLAQVRLQQRNFNEADRLYAQLFALDKSPATLLNRIKARMLQQDEASLKALADEFDAGSADQKAAAQYIHVLIAKQKNDAAAALSHIDKALEISPAFGPALHEKAVHLVHEGNVEAALECFARLESAAVKPVSSWHVDHGIALMAAGKFDDARTQAMEQYLLSADAEALILLVAIEMKAGKPDTAKKHIDDFSARTAELRPLNAITQLPAGPRILEQLVLADLFARNGRAAWSQKSLEQAGELAPESHDLAVIRARALIRVGNTAEARKLLEAAVQARPQRADFKMPLAELHQSENRNDEAIEQYKHIIEIDGDSVRALRAAGTLLQAKGEYQAASDYLLRAIRLAQKDVVSLNNFVWLTAVDLKSPQKALPYAENLLDLAPSNGHALDTAGWVFLLNNDFERAEKALSQAVVFAPRDADVAYHHGIALLKNGKRSQALAELKRAKTLDPNFKSAAEADSAIAELERTAVQNK
ncbi:MAG TPA: tetratricopeptide repeat protein [Planctomycetota bacterium]|nr:tetratricopeptide repeat protein [Planctomycetota bacterium]